MQRAEQVVLQTIPSECEPHLRYFRAGNSAVELLLYTESVRGSTPFLPTLLDLKH